MDYYYRYNQVKEKYEVRNKNKTLKEVATMKEAQEHVKHLSENPVGFGDWTPAFMLRGTRNDITSS